MPTIAAGHSEATVRIIVPPDLPAHVYQLAIRGDLLSPDGKRVLAETLTPVLRAQAIARPADHGRASDRTASDHRSPKNKARPLAESGPNKPLAIFEDQGDFVANLTQGHGRIGLVTDDKFSGAAAVKVTPDQRFNSALPGLAVKIRQHPGPGEYRYLTFAWKKQGGKQICLQLNHDGQWGPTADAPNHKFRYQAGAGPECFGASLSVAEKLPADWVLVTRDLYADFGEFTLTGVALSPIDGRYALFDHIYLARRRADLEPAKKP